MSLKKLFGLLAALALASLVFAACQAPQPQVVEKIVTQVVKEQVQVVQTQVVETVKEVEKVVTTEVEKVVEKAAEDFTAPHPILSDVRVRQAIAYCSNRDDLIESVYPFVPDEEKAELRMDTFVPKTHWAWSGPYEGYDYDPDKGRQLLEEAGWTLAEGDDFRENAAGETLAVKFTTTTAQFRQTWAAVFEQNMADCGIQLVRQHVPGSWWFGDTTGLARRDFELGAYATVGESDPKGRTAYACDQIPLASNNWVGQNYSGWCNETASKAVIAANNTLDRAERIRNYDILHKEFAKDMVVLPLFQRVEAEAWNPKLEGVRVSPTEYASKSIASWKLSDGGDTVVIGFSQEPASMFTLVETAAVQRQAADIGIGIVNTQYDYDYQPALQDPLSTLESGLSVNGVVEVKAGDQVYTSAGQSVKLEAGVEIFDADGNLVTYDGSSTIRMKQLTSTYKFKPYTWSDGAPGTIDDWKLAQKIDCDIQSGATTFEVCDQIQDVQYSDSALEYTVTWLPGSQYSLCFLAPIGQYNGPYPSHQVLSDGRKLADVPPVEWATLPEIAELPLSYGPFVLTEWNKGQSMTFTPNEHFEPAPLLKSVVIQFFPDSQTAVAALLGGDVDYLEKATLGAGAEVQTVVDAAAEGQVVVELSASPTWEHVDFNLYTR